MEDACNHFLHAKRQQLDSGELALTTWNDYQRVAKQLLEALGRTRVVEDLRGDDFDQLRKHFAKRSGLVSLANKINRARIIFKYCYDAELIDRPVRFGANFKRPSAKAIRRQRKPKMFEADEIHAMLQHATPIMKAMIFLGVNCGFGCTDVGRLPLSAVDLGSGWVDFPRPKTGTDRKVPLWRETTEALATAIDQRPCPVSGHEYLLFLTRRGHSFDKDSTRYLSEQFRKLQDLLGIHQTGRGFYTLRHVFETIGGESRDQPAVDAIMGHERGDMASNYRERVSSERLRAVVDTVRKWLFQDVVEQDADNDHEPAVLPFVGKKA